MNHPIITLTTLLLLTCCTTQYTGQHPVNPSASEEARELLSFLYSIQGRYTLSGEHNFAGDLLLYDDEVFAMTGKRPVVWGSDFSFRDIGDGFERYQHAGPATITVPFGRPCLEDILTLEQARQNIVDEAITKWHEGRIITLMWHCCDPRQGGSNDCNGDKVWTLEQNAPTQEEWDSLCTESTTLNDNWKREMDTVIPYLKQLQEAGVPVLWRPFHEMNGAWFWWGNKPGENGFKRLWILTYNYMALENGLNNLLWVFDPNAPRVKKDDDAFPYEWFYPGNEYVDILAADIYARDFRQSHHDQLIELGGGKPIAMGEVGQLPESVSLLEEQPGWTWFMVWGYFIGRSSGPEEQVALVRSFYESPKVLTLDEVKFAKGRHTVMERN